MIELLKKDLLYFFRSGSSLAMILIVPALTMLLLGNMFGESQATDVQVLLCDIDGSQMSASYRQLFNSSVFRTTFRSDEGCTDDGIDRVRTGRIAAAVIVPKGFEENIKSGQYSTVRLYLDNSVDETAQLIESSVRALSREMSSSIALSTLSVLQDSMNRLGTKMFDAEYSLQETRTKLSSIEGKIGVMVSELEGLELSSFEKSLGEMKSFLSNQSDSLKEVNSTVNTAIGEAKKANDTVQESRLLLADADDLLEEDIRQTEEIILVVGEVEGGVQLLYDTAGCTPSTCGELYSVLSNITSVKSGLEERVDAEKEMRGRIGNVSEGLDGIEGSLANATQSLSEAKQESAELEVELRKMELELEELNSTLLGFSESRKTSLDALRESNSSLKEMDSQLAEALPNIRQIRENLFSLSSTDAETLVSPIKVSSERLFFATRFSYVFPALVSIVLMFSILLLSSNSIFYEIDEGTLLRSYLSATPLWKIVLSKITVLTSVALVQTFVMYGVSFAAFGIQLSNLPSFFIVALVLSLCFILLGMAIGTASGDQSTALLVIVAITIPSIFLSGSLFPFEFMPSLLRQLSQALPLTIGADMMKQMTVYNFYKIRPEMTIYIASFALALFYILPKKLRH